VFVSILINKIKILDFYDNKLNIIFLSETSYDVKNRSSIFKYLQ